MNATFKGLWRLLRQHAVPRFPILGVVTVLAAVTAFLQAAVLGLFDPIWNKVLFPNPEAGPSPIADYVLQQVSRFTGQEDPRLAILLGLVVLALAMAVVAGAAQYGCTWLARWVGYQMIVDLRVRLARHLMGLSMRYHGERHLGDLLSRVSSDVTTTLQVVNTAFKGLLQEPLFAIAALGLAVFMAPLPTLGMAILLPALAFPISKLSRKVRRGSRKSLDSLGASVQVLTQMFQGVRTVKSFGGEERELESYREENKRYLRASLKMVRAISMTQAWTAFYSMAGFALLVGALGWLTIRYSIFDDAGEMTVWFLAIARTNNHIKNAVRALTRIQESLGASARIVELLDEAVDVVEHPEAKPIAEVRESIRFEGVDLTYAGASEKALTGVDLEIRPGETLALVGASGAGKSTVVDLVARFIDPTAGRITVDGVDLRKLRLSDWTAQYALVGQVPFLFHATIGENIRYGRPGASDEDVRAAAEAANIAEFIEGLPDGYETDVADMGARLSGGQRQRITIARALLKGAPLLLLDEATSALDSQSEAEVQKALDRLMAERTVIVIAHRLSTIRNADRIAVLDGGRLVEVGQHEELLAQDGAYASFHALQV